MTSWNMVESVKKQACLLTAAFAQHLSVKVHWLCQWTFFEFVLGSFKPDFVTKESVNWPLHNRSGPLTRHSKGCWTPPLKHDWLNIGKNTHTLHWHIFATEQETSPFGMTKWILWPLKGPFGSQVPFTSFLEKSHKQDLRDHQQGMTRIIVKHSSLSLQLGFFLHLCRCSRPLLGSRLQPHHAQLGGVRILQPDRLSSFEFGSGSCGSFQGGHQLPLRHLGSCLG